MSAKDRELSSGTTRGHSYYGYIVTEMCLSWCLPLSPRLPASMTGFCRLFPPLLPWSSFLGSSFRGFWSFLTSLVRHFLNFRFRFGCWCSSSLSICLPFVFSYVPTGPLAEWAWMKEFGSYVFVASIVCLLPVRLLAYCYLPFGFAVKHNDDHVPCCRVVFPVHASSC